SVLASVRESLLEDVMTEMFGQSFPYRFGDRFGKIHAFVTAGTSVSVTGLSTHDRGELAGSSKTFAGDGVASAATDTSDVTWGNTVVGGQIDHRSSRLPLRVQLVGGWSGADNTFGPPDAPTRVSEIESVDAALHADLLLDWPVRLGGTRRATTLAYALAGQFEQPDEAAEATLTEWTAYAETDVRAGSVTITPGLHAFHLSERNETGVEPRLRVTWRPAEPVRIDVAAGRYHQAIAGVNDQRDVGSVFTAWIPMPTTDPLPTATHVVAGSSVQIQPWLSVAAEAFWKQYDELAVPFFTAFPRFNTRLQPAEGDAIGLDLRADFDGYPFLYESALDGYVSYGLSRVEYRSPQATYPPPHDRRHQFNAVLRATRGDVGLTVQLQAGSGLPFTPSGGFDRWYPFDPSRDVTTAQGDVRVLYGEPFSSRQPAYQRVDVWLEHRFEQGRIAGALRGGVINLLNRKNLFYFDLFTLQRVDQLPLTPSVGIKLEVR
ncbi:MAG: TonB-dependent receptor, partial [Bacteroidota bacterium]